MELKEGYKQTEIGVIPDDWEVLSYGNAFIFLSTASYSRSELTINDEFNYVHYGDIHTKFNHFLDFKNSNLPTINSDKAKRYSLIINGDLIMADASEDYDGVGKTVEVINCDNTKAISGLHTFLFRDKNNYFADYFKAYIAENQLVKNSFRRLATGMKVYGVSKTNLKSILIPLPPLPEQKAIAEVLSDADELIQSLKTLIAKKKALKQGAMQKLLTGKKRLPGFTEEWEVKKLGEVAFIKTGSKNNQDKISDGIYPFFVRSQSVERINSYSYDCEAILVPGEGGIGSIFHYINGKFDVHQRVYVISDFSQNVFGKYIYLFMKEHFGAHAMKNSVKATVDSLRLPTFQEFEIKIPKNIKEQQAIAQVLSDMDAEIAALEKQLQKTQALKQGMMQELLTGRIRLMEPVTRQETEPVAMVTEPEAVNEIDTKHKNHNEHINDAVLIGTMANAFGSEKFPLTRFMYTKVSYLLKRYKEEHDIGYLKKAAGPYKPKTRYGGAEKIALQNHYVKKYTSNYKGKKYENFLAGDNVTEAINYFKDWYGESALQWIQEFKYTKRNQLELWATVDMAIEDLKEENKPVNIRTIKELINNHKEWRPKLKRPIFSDENIKTAINKLNQLFE